MDGFFVMAQGCTPKIKIMHSYNRSAIYLEVNGKEQSG